MPEARREDAEHPPTGFFDSFPRFYETGNTPAGARLNARHECLIERHRPSIEGRTILDVGSHDGRWILAAIAAGATHVTGIEPRGTLVEAATENLRGYGIAPTQFSFSTAGALETLGREDIRVDTVFLFGILYHIHDHVSLMQAVWKTRAETVIVDTHLAPPSESGTPRNNVNLVPEPIDSISNALDEIFPGAGVAIVGHPSRQAVQFLFQAFQFDFSEVPWAPYLERWGTTGLEDYAAGRRATFLATRPRKREQSERT